MATHKTKSGAVIRLAPYVAAKRVVASQAGIHEQQAVLQHLRQRVGDGAIRGMVIITAGEDGESELLICGLYGSDRDAAIAATTRMVFRICADEGA